MGLVDRSHRPAGVLTPRIEGEIEHRPVDEKVAGGQLGEGAGDSLLSKSEQETLKSILPYVKYVATGVGGKPTIQFSGANVHINLDRERLIKDTVAWREAGG